MSAMYDGRAASGWGEFLGTTAALMTDPVNITATVMTAGIGETATLTLSAAAGASARAGAAAFARGLARTALYEGVSNAASEALIQPSVYQYKQELGFDYAAGDAVKTLLPQVLAAQRSAWRSKRPVPYPPECSAGFAGPRRRPEIFAPRRSGGRSSGRKAEA